MSGYSGIGWTRSWLVSQLKKREQRYPRTYNWLRRTFGRSSSSPLAAETLSYPDWLRFHVTERTADHENVHHGQFSFLTTVYNTPALFLKEAADSLFNQSAYEFEWILLDNGSQDSNSISEINRIKRDKRVRYFRVERNLGIVGGMSFCLKQASNEYIIPVDSDDLLFPDALQLLAFAIKRESDRGITPGIIYSDEDILVDGKPSSPYLRPDWDPALNFCTSYIWHLCAINREQALKLGVYSDPGANWCHDWDTTMRFHAAGFQVAHAPYVLYHWRQHRQSSTNRPDPDSGSMQSQRYLLQREIDKLPVPENFEIILSPIDRGSPELWVRRRHVNPWPLDVVLYSSPGGSPGEWLVKLLSESKYPFRRLIILNGPGISAELKNAATEILERNYGQYGVTMRAGFNVEEITSADTAALLKSLSNDGAVVVSWEQVMPENDEWPWEACGLTTLHPDTAIVAGRILNPHRVILGGSEVLGFNGLIGCPDRGRPEADHGYNCIASKTHSVSGPHPAFFIADTQFLAKALENIPEQSTRMCLGAWLGAEALRQKRRVVYSAYVTALAEAGFDPPRDASPSEMTAFVQRHPDALPDFRFYSRHFGFAPETAFKFASTL